MQIETGVCGLSGVLPPEVDGEVKPSAVRTINYTIEAPVRKVRPIACNWRS